MTRYKIMVVPGCPFYGKNSDSFFWFKKSCSSGHVRYCYHRHEGDIAITSIKIIDFDNSISLERELITVARNCPAQTRR